MRFDWRAMYGPALAATTIAIAVALDRWAIAFPDPAPLLVGIVAYAASLSGLTSGLVSAAIATAAYALPFLHQGLTSGNDSEYLLRLSMLAATATGTAIVTGLLRRKMVDKFARAHRHHATAERLSAALDEVDIGIVLLDRDTRAEFINRAFRDYFSLPDAKADTRPPFIALMYHGRDTGAFELPEDELSGFIARRTAMMRAGDRTPININLADGQVLRLVCTALPDGGRMLSYTPVTDLVRATDDPANLDYYQSLRGGNRTLARQLRAAE